MMMASLKSTDPNALLEDIVGKCDVLSVSLHWMAQIRTMVSEQFPETRNKSDSEMAGFLHDRYR